MVCVSRRIFERTIVIKPFGMCGPSNSRRGRDDRRCHEIAASIVPKEDGAPAREYGQVQPAVAIKVCPCHRAPRLSTCCIGVSNTRNLHACNTSIIGRRRLIVIASLIGVRQRVRKVGDLLKCAPRVSIELSGGDDIEGCQHAQQWSGWATRKQMPRQGRGGAWAVAWFAPPSLS